MVRIKVVVAALGLLVLSACQTMGAKGIDATECFSSGGVIDNSGESSVCSMKDGTTKPIT